MNQLYLLKLPQDSKYINMNNIRVATTTSHARRKFGSVSDEVGDVHWHLINLGGVEPSKLRWN